MHNVTVCGDIRRAMDAIKNAEPMELDRAVFDLIICAVHIDGTSDISVFDLLKWAKGNPQVKRTPFLILDLQPSYTAKYLHDSVRLAGNAIGAAGYVVMEHFDARAFRKQIEFYLARDLRSVETDDADERDDATDSVKREIAEILKTDAKGTDDLKRRRLRR